MSHESKLIIIRGNSGSGKSTVAKALRSAMRERYGRGSTMLVSQDQIRVEMLDVKDTEDNESIALIHMICQYGRDLGMHVILDGILDRWKYGEMLTRLMDEWSGSCHVYYYDVPLEVTLARHDLRPQRTLFTKDNMRGWYNTDNKLNLEHEITFDETISAEDAVNRILADIAD